MIDRNISGRGDIFFKQNVTENQIWCSNVKNGSFYKHKRLIIRLLDFINFHFSTVQDDYFEHLERFCRLLEPIIEDLERKGFI